MRSLQAQPQKKRRGELVWHRARRPDLRSRWAWLYPGPDARDIHVASAQGFWLTEVGRLVRNPCAGGADELRLVDQRLDLLELDRAGAARHRAQLVGSTAAFTAAVLAHQCWCAPTSRVRVEQVEDTGQVGGAHGAVVRAVGVAERLERCRRRPDEDDGVAEVQLTVAVCVAGRG